MEPHGCDLVRNRGRKEHWSTGRGRANVQSGKASPNVNVIGGFLPLAGPIRKSICKVCSIGPNVHLGLMEVKLKQVFCAVAITAMSACMGGGEALSSMGAPSPTPPPAAPTNFAAMLNQVRADNGSGPVQYDARLGLAAQLHANDMLAMRDMTHVGSDGSSVGQRVLRQGYHYRIVGENIARGQQTEQSVLTAWVNSSGHQANNINPLFEDFGLGKAGSGSQLYWALVLASER